MNSLFLRTLDIKMSDICLSYIYESIMLYMWPNSLDQIYCGKIN